MVMGFSVSIVSVSREEAPGSEDAHFARSQWWTNEKNLFLRKKEKPEAVLPEVVKS